MALGKNELVIGGILRVIRVPAHLREEQAGGEIRGGEQVDGCPSPPRGHAQTMDAEPGGDLRRSSILPWMVLLDFGARPRRA